MTFHGRGISAAAVSVRHCLAFLRTNPEDLVSGSGTSSESLLIHTPDLLAWEQTLQQ